MSSPREVHNESYPWAACTPEASPRYWGAEADAPAKPMLSLELLRMVCEPCFEQICCLAQQAACRPTVSRKMLRSMCEPAFEQMIIVLQQMTKATRELLQAVCEPFFEQMITSLQQTMQQPSWQPYFHNQCQSMQMMNQSATGMQMMNQSATGMCFQPVFYQNTRPLGLDEASTDADDSPASASFFSPSSDGEGADGIAGKSEDSESTGDAERSVMVCRHWKSKGWCRLESKCKFLHPEHKCGISATKALSGRTHGPSMLVDAISAESAVPEMPAVQRRKRADRNGSTRRQEGQLANA